MVELETPLSIGDANALSVDFAFRRRVDGDAIFAVFNTRQERDAAATALRKRRMEKWRMQDSEMSTNQSA